MSQGASAVYLLMAVLLVASAFAARRVPIGRTLQMFLAWAGIFALGFVVMSFRHDLGDLFGSRVLGRAVVAGGTVRIPMDEDGHFWVDAEINGATIRLMVDSGATVTTLSRTSAAKAGVTTSGGLPVLVGTANGIVQAERARAATFAVGNIAVPDLAVHLAPNDDIDVIGMNFLSRLSGWSVEGRWLVLKA